jgi:intergrase/recombinase
MRDWFYNEMVSLSVQVGIGRASQSVLARHYIDYSPERLKKVYETSGQKFKKHFNHQREK